MGRASGATCYLLLGALALLTSCSWMTEDLSECPTGLYLKFKYDYNLQRADMFADHVGAVTAYIYDENDNLVKTQTEYNSGSYAPLSEDGYLMHVTGLEAGKYRVIALAQQSYESLEAVDNRPKFVRNIGSQYEDLEVTLDHNKSGDYYTVDHNGLPLDTLWHAIEKEYIDVYTTKPTYDTLSLVRDTKKINVTLREIADPTKMDVADYGFTFSAPSPYILNNNVLDETEKVVYTRHETWNTYDRDEEDTSEADIEGAKTRASEYGVIAHADFMTSRLLYHTSASDDAILSITELNSGEEVICVNLVDLLSRLRTSEERYVYTRQQFLDRGYNYQLDFYLNEGELQYVNISISVGVLSWAMRVQYVDLK